MKASQIAAKAVVRVFFILLLVALVPFAQGDTAKLQHLYLQPKHAYMLAFPLLLILGFIALLVTCSIKKYSRVDLNWLLVVNTVVLTAYAATLYISIYHFVN